MGVQGLWDLVAPAGRRVKIQTLEGKVLAIDVSIWLIRMLHGSVSLGKNEFKNIHLVGILKRIIKLMYYGIKPVFVFDGKFPELKRETVQNRQMMREKRKRNLKKIAEKYLTKVLEERIKETISRVNAPKKRQSSENKPPLNFGEEEETYLETEDEKQQRKKREQDDREREEAQAAGHGDAILYDYEFDLIVEENRELLIENGIDLDEFNKQESAKQYDTIKKVRNKMRERKMKNYLAIDSLDEFSKIHVNDYVKHCKRKLKLEKNREEANTKRLNEEQDNVLGNLKFSDVSSNEYMKNLFLNPEKNVMQGALASNRNKGFIYMVQKDKKLDNQVLKLGNKRQNKFERLKKLNLKLREIAQNAETGPSFFSYDELLCDNPLDAFKHHTDKVDPIPARNGLEGDEEDTQGVNNVSQENIDVDEVFGFNDWAENDNNENRDDSSRHDSNSDKEEENERQEYEQQRVEVEEKEQGRQEQLPTIVEKVEECDEDLFDLFEYKIDGAEEKPEAKISPPKATHYKPSFIDLAKQEKVENFSEKLIVEKMHIEKIDTSTGRREGSPDEGKRVQVKGSKKKASPVGKAIVEEYAELSNNKDMGKPSVEKTIFSVYKGVEMMTPEDRETRTASTKNTVLKFSPESENLDRDEASTMKKSFFGRLRYNEGKTSPQEGKSHLSLIQELTEEPTQKKIKTQADQGKRETMTTRVLELDDKNSEKIEEETSKPMFFKKATIEDPCVVDEKADLFWRRNSGLDDKKEKKTKKEKEVEVKEENVKVEVKDEEIIEIQYEKPGSKKITVTKEEVKEIKAEEESMTTPFKQPGEVNQDSNKFSAGSQEEFFEDMDEAKILEQMKELEENETLDKWALMEEFQKFQNLSELEGDSIQEKLREIKEMLVMFGIPWVESPAEAEAQCAFLEMSGLVDGVVTDDSDVFLFGARHVYRNIFDKGDFVYSYPMKYVENELALDRSKLILMALFLGSDYTLGIRGVGIVNAMEIVRAFESPEALERFRNWAELPDVLMEDASTHYKNIPVKELEYKLYHRNFKKHWELPDNFPDKRVIEAYEKPLVDPSEEKFEWGVPDVENLEGLCRNRFKWDLDRINNTLEPLKKAMKERTGQKKITDFFREEKIAVINSKRINQAIAAFQNKDKNDERDEIAIFSEALQKKLEQQNHNNLKKKKTEEDLKGEEELEGFAYRRKPKRTTTL